MRRALIALASAAAAAFGVGACGGDSGDEIAGISEITPADAFVYVDAVIRPEGEQKEQIEGFLSTVLADDDPGAEIVDLIDEGLAENAKENKTDEATFDEDIEPWLGDEAGFFVLGAGEDPPVLTAIDSNDTEAGVEFFRSQSTETQDREYGGISYEIGDEGQAFGELEGFVFVGDEAAVKAAIDTTQGEEEPLTDSDQFDEAVADVPEEAVGRIYTDLEQVAEEFAQSLAEDTEVPPGVAADAVDQFEVGSSLVASLVPAEDSVALDIEGLGGGENREVPPDVLGDIPFDAFFAVGLSDVSGKAKNLIDAIEEFGVPGLSRDVIAGALELQAGLDLDEDVLSWPGDAAFFLRGTDPGAVEGVLVIDSKDDIAAARTLDGLREALEADGTATAQPLELGGAGGSGFELETAQFPEPLNFVQRNGKVAIGLGDAATEQALNSTETLADSPEFKTATGTLGEGGPAFYLSVPEGLNYLEQRPEGQDPEFQAALPYLKRLAFLTAGTNEGALRIVLGAE